MTSLDLARRAHALFMRAMDHDSSSRRAFVRGACADDADLLKHVLDLLDAADRSTGFLETPAVDDPMIHGRPVPDAVGTYLVVDILGVGGMATVYEAIQDDPKRRVALKVLHRSVADTEAYQRFRFETEALARLRHPGIAQIYEAGAARLGQPSPSPFFAMELVPDAAPITAFVQRRQLSIRGRVELFVLVCDAIHHGHQHGVIHRDIKPGNVLVDGEGNPKVIDFGIARASDSVTITVDHRQLLGTLNYMSPEQCEASGDVDVRSDVYSLGVLLYELMTNRLPHDVSRKSIPEAMRIITHEEPPRAGGVCTEVSGDLEAIIAKAMQKDRQRRYIGAAALAADLRRWLNQEPIEARAPSLIDQARYMARRHRVLVPAAAVVSLSILAIAIISTVFAVRLGDEVRDRRRAQNQMIRDRDLARWQAYTAQIAGALSAMKTGEFQQMRTRLAAADHPKRGWEWGFLSRMSERSLRTIPAHDDMVMDLAASHDWGVLATAASDGTVRLWNADDLSRLATFDADDGGRAFTVSFTRDATFVITGNNLGVVRLLDGRDLRFIRTIGEMSSPVRSAIELPDGRFAAAADNRAAAIWARDSAEMTAFPSDQPGGVQGLAVSRDGTMLATYNDLGNIWIRDPGDLAIRGRLRFPGAVMAVRFSDDGALVGAAGAGGVVCVWNLETGDILHQFDATGGVNAVRSLAFSHDGKHVAAGLIHRGIVIGSIHDGKIIGEFLGHTEAVSGVHFCPADGVLVSSSWDGTIRTWRTAESSSPAGITYLHGRGDHLRSVAFTSDGSIVAAASRDGTLRLWDPALALPIGEFNTEGQGLHAIAFSPDASLLAAAASDATVRLWDTFSGAALPTLHGHGEWTTSVAFDASGTRLIAGGHDRTARVWSLPDGIERLTLTGHEGRITSAAFSPDGRIIATGSRDKTVRLWDARTGRELRRLGQHHSDVHVVLFSADGRRLYSGSRDQTIHVWNIPSGELVTVLDGHGQHITSLSLNRDETRLAAGSWFGEVLLFDVETYDLIASFRAHDAAVRGVSFSPDGRWIATASNDGTLGMFDSTSREDADAVRQAAAAALARADALVRRTIQDEAASSGVALNTARLRDQLGGQHEAADWPWVRKAVLRVVVPAPPDK